MSDPTRKELPQEMASAVNLFVHPAAGAAALSALGMGFASQAFGMWLGALTGASEASQKLWQPLAEGVKPADVDKAVSQRVEVAVRAEAPTANEIMPEDFRKPKAMDRPDVPDDLKAISGVGPKLEQVLNGMGIWTYGQIAGWSAEEIAWVDDMLGFRGRIGRDGWLAQAAALSAGHIKQ
jgi:NADH-quinone oxidoreductase subunit E